MDKEIRKAKIFNYVALGIVCLLVIAVISFIIYQKTKPLSDSVTVEHLKMETSETNSYILAKISDEYYETNASDEFGSLFAFDDWKLISNKPDGELCISLRFAEQYILEIFDNGYVAAYDGYAPRKTVSYAYYTIPEHVANSVTSYLRQNGIPHEIGDGAIGMGTFNH